MNGDLPRILVIGCGSPGLLDDGLGPAAADMLESLDLPGVSVESGYQLTVEDAAMVAAHDFAVFADAAVSGRAPYSFRRITRPEAGGAAYAGMRRFTSHHLEPADLLELSHRLFGREPQGYVLAIRGYEFNGFGERLSSRAEINLGKAVRFLEAAVNLRFAQSALLVEKRMRCGTIHKVRRAGMGGPLLRLVPPPRTD